MNKDQNNQLNYQASALPHSLVGVHAVSGLSSLEHIMSKHDHRKADNKYRKTEKGRMHRRLWQKQCYYRTLNYQRALSAVKYAVKTGKLPPVNTLQCSCCPEIAQQYHHNRGYAKKHWLDVIPVCLEYHIKIHKR